MFFISFKNIKKHLESPRKHFFIYYTIIHILFKYIVPIYYDSLTVAYYSQITYYTTGGENEDISLKEIRPVY